MFSLEALFNNTKIQTPPLHSRYSALKRESWRNKVLNVCITPLTVDLFQSLIPTTKLRFWLIDNLERNMRPSVLWSRASISEHRSEVISFINQRECEVENNEQLWVTVMASESRMSKRGVSCLGVRNTFVEVHLFFSYWVGKS